MLRAVKNFVGNHDWQFGLGGILVAMMSVAWGIWYVESHTTVYISDDVKVVVSGGRVWYADHVEKTGWHNQFYASNELGGSGMAMEPHFRVVNVGQEARYVKIHSLESWQVPISKTVHLEPGQEFEFEFKAKNQHWYCWINPIRDITVDLTKIWDKKEI